MENRQERLQATNELFPDQEAEALITNQGIINVCAEIKEVGTTTHDEWYGDLRNTGPTLDKWYDHVVAPRSTRVTRRQDKA